MKPDPTESGAGERDAAGRFHEHLAAAAADGSWVKLTLARPDGSDRTLQRVLIRPVTLRTRPHLSLVHRHTTRDLTQNLPLVEGLAWIREHVGKSFRAAHLHTTADTWHLELPADGPAQLHRGPPAAAVTGAPAQTHDRQKLRAIAADTPWLAALGVTDDTGRVRADMAAKFRQINHFVELLAPLFDRLPSRSADASPFRVVDMGCGKGYLTFAVHHHLRSRGWAPQTTGVESRSELVNRIQQVARSLGESGLDFLAASIAAAPLAGVDAVIALHACDTATDDAIARGIAAGASVIVVAPCCQRELRPQLVAPPVLAGPLRHGIFRERTAEFVTDALRAALLEWAGYDTTVAEFIAAEHTHKNLMIAGVRRGTPPSPADRAERARQIRELAAFHGIRSQRLAQHLGLALSPAESASPST